MNKNKRLRMLKHLHSNFGRSSISITTEANALDANLRSERDEQKQLGIIFITLEHSSIIETFFVWFEWVGRLNSKKHIKTKTNEIRSNCMITLHEQTRFNVPWPCSLSLRQRTLVVSMAPYLSKSNNTTNIKTGASTNGVVI